MLSIPSCTHTGPCTSDWHPGVDSSLTLVNNRGRSGEEVRDYEYSFMNTRRHSNSSVQGISGFKTKFETIEPEPVFEEDLHGPLNENIIDGAPVVKADSVSSGTSGGGEIQKAADQKNSAVN